MKINADKFFEFIKEHGFRVFTALVTGTLTYYAGYTVSQTAAYALTLVMLVEGMSLYWPYRLESAQSVGERKNINVSGVAQFGAAIVGSVIAWGSIIVTDLASAVFIANAQGYEVLTAFESIPQWSQDVVVYVLPVLGFTQGLLLSIFYIASPEAAHSRALRAIERDGAEKIRTANARAEEARVKAYTAKYERDAAGAAARRGESDADAAITQRYSPNTVTPQYQSKKPPAENPTPAGIKQEPK